SGNGAGDYGFCAPACTAQDECQNPEFWCFPVGGLTGMGVDNGFCFGATACPHGDSDCAQEQGTVCTQTKYGPECLNPLFPRGGAAPADAGTDGSGGTGGGGTGGGGTGGGGTGGGGTGGSGTGGGGTGGGGTGGCGGATPVALTVKNISAWCDVTVDG